MQSIFLWREDIHFSCEFWRRSEKPMSSTPFAAGRWPERETSNEIIASDRLRKTAVLLRTVFLVALVIVTIHVSLPQTSTLWTIYEVPGDLIRVVLGFVVSFGVAIQIFLMPKDTQAHRAWFYLGLATVPFIVICIVAIW
jgi:mannose/fructose/N-acetylgalactosamine-specific phosphotransferase system component IIC